MTEKSSSRTQIFISILGGVFIIIAAIISSPHWFKYFFPEQFIEQEATPTKKIKNEQNKEIENTKNSGYEKLIIDRIDLCPVNSELPAYIYFELKNDGTKTLENVSLNLNLGRASFKGIDIIGNNIANIDTSLSNQLIVTFSSLKENDTKSIYCLLSQPIFKSININGDNLTFSKEYSYKDFIENNGKKKTNLNNFFIFLQLLIGAILIVFALYFVLVIFQILHKKNLIKWG